MILPFVTFEKRGPWVMYKVRWCDMNMCGKAKTYPECVDRARQAIRHLHWVKRKRQSDKEIWG